MREHGKSHCMKPVDHPAKQYPVMEDPSAQGDRIDAGTLPQPGAYSCSGMDYRLMETGGDILPFHAFMQERDDITSQLVCIDDHGGVFTKGNDKRSGIRPSAECRLFQELRRFGLCAYR